MFADSAPVPYLKNDQLTYLNTDDASDIYALTEHLIREHDFTGIHFLSGAEQYHVSQRRAEAFIQAMQKHNLNRENGRVFWGDFWYTSGKKLASFYLNGDVPIPQAVICANDIMAYGLLDELLVNGITVPETVSVVSYECTGERFRHFPILTSFRRNRRALGRKGCAFLLDKTGHTHFADEITVYGKLINGSTCSCGIDPAQNLKMLLQRIRNINPMS